MFESLEFSQDSQTSSSSGNDYSREAPTPTETGVTVITDGWYRDGKNGRKFEIKIYLNPETGEPFTLVPLFVQNPPERWLRIR